jgi:hypothetical protein
VLNGRINTLDLGKDVCDGLNKIVLFYGNKIETPTRLDKISAKMSEKEWYWCKINGMKYLLNPNTGALYDNINLFPSGYYYPDGTWTFTKQPPSLTSSLNDPDIKEYSKNPTKQTNKSGMDWAAYWQKRKAKEAAEGKQAKPKEKKPAKNSIAAITAKMTTIHL